MMNPEMALGLARSRQTELVRTMGPHPTASRQTRRGERAPVPARPPLADRSLLLARASDLVVLAARSGYGRDELVQLIRSLS